MTLVLEVPEDLSDELSVEAAKLGLSVAEYALRLLASAPIRSSPTGNGAELVAYWEAEGLIGSRREIVDSSAHARELRARAESMRGTRS